MNRQLTLISNICGGLCLLLLLSACTYSFQFQDVKVTDVPIDVLKPGTQEVNVDVVFETVTQRVHETLPKAYFQGMVFSGRCQDLPHLQGKLVLVFRQVRMAIPRQQVVRATASVDTLRQTMDLYYEDVSNFYPSTKHRTFSGDHSIKEIAAIAHQHITELGLCDGDVTLTQLNDSWDVRCGSLSDFIQKCRFEIENAKIRDSTR
ncbi:MAG: hypothetical protein ACP5R2_15170 [Anaerolineae bacterium]